MARKYREYTNEDIIKYSKEVYSLSGLLKKLDLKPAGGNFISIRRKLFELGLECKHWRGQAWNKEQRLKDWSKYTRGSALKKHLIKDRGIKCEKCLNITWQNKDIPLELYHKDGDRTNNKLENLELLCPNCHALTDNWRNKKRKNY